MGVVYLAVDTDLNRQVAMKIVRPPGRARGQAPGTPFDAPAPAVSDVSDPDDPFVQLRERFLREAMVTGLMEHPGVIPVYELGQTDAGVPYYTMRDVRGRRTLRVAMDEAKTVDERLALLEPFLKVCDTLAYAHARGIIHRDLKPENVALGEFGEVIVLDWGLAKLKGQAEDAPRGATMVRFSKAASGSKTVEGVLGTPGYMSPEAALGDLDQVDDRSDVFSLGVLLFEILTGRLPFPASDVLAWLAKVVGEDAPHARTVAPAVPAALDAICAAALARARGARIPNALDLASRVRAWQQASALEREVEGSLLEAEAALSASVGLKGADLLRQLDAAAASAGQALERRPDEPRARSLLARAEEMRERGLREREAAARRTLLLRIGGAVTAVAAVATFFVVQMLAAGRHEAEVSADLARASEAQMRLERDRADGERKRADQQTAEAMVQRDAATKALATAETERRRADQQTTEAMVQRDAAKNAQASAETERKRAVEAEAAAKKNLDRAEELMSFLVFRVRDVVRPLGKLDLLEEVAQKALKFFDALPPEATTPQTLRHQSVALDILGDVQDERGDHAAALATYRRALGVAQLLAKQAPDDLNLRHDVSVDHVKIGSTLQNEGEPDEALASFRAAEEIVRGLVKEDGESTEYRYSLAISLSDVGDVLVAKGDLVGAGKALDESLAVARTLAQSEPAVARWRGLIAAVLDSVGSLRKAQDDKPGSLASYAEALAIRRELVAAEPSDAGAQYQLSVAFMAHGAALSALDRPKEAVESTEAGVAIAKRLVEADASNANWIKHLGGSLSRHAGVLEALERWADAVGARRAALVVWKSWSAAAPDDLARGLLVTEAYDALADTHTAAKDDAAALATSRECLELHLAIAKAHPDETGLARNVSVQENRIGRLERRQGRGVAAVAAHRQALAIVEPLAKATPTDGGLQADVAYTWWRLGEALADAPATRAEGKAFVERALAAVEGLRETKAVGDELADWLTGMKAALEAVKAGKPAPK